MYIRKSVLVVCSILLAIVVATGTVMVVNPFGALNFEDFLKFRVGVAALDRLYYEEIEPETLVDGALLGATYSTEDPYTVYMTEEEAESFMESVESDDYSGVGLYITSSEDGKGITVISALANSPAEEMGIVSGDKILEVDEVPVAGKTLQQVANEMKGAEGTEVTLKIIKKSTGRIEDIVLKRAQIKRETVVSRMLDDENAYIQITQFGINTSREFIEHFNELARQGMRRLVIDLRNNPGGYMEIAVEIADAFLDEGEIVYTLDKSGKKNSHMAKKGKTELPMVILINAGSASASEILVGALCDHNLAKTVGEKTFGKGVTQIPYELWDGSVIKITNSRYYTPKGVCIDHEGIAPDFEVKMSEEEYLNISESDISSDRQLKQAMEILNSK